MRGVSGFESKVLLAFASAALVVAALAGSIWKLVGDEADATQRVARSHELISSLARVRARTLQIELATQNFRLTGDPARIEERDSSIARREQLLQRIRLLTEQDALQRGRWDQLRAVIDQRLQFARQIETLRKTEGEPAATAYVASVPLAATRQQVYNLLTTMEDEEVEQLAQRSAGELRTHRALSLSGALLALCLLALLVGVFELIRRQLRVSEDHLRSIISNLPAMIAYVDAGQRYVYVNQQYLQRFAPAQGDITGRSVREVLGEARYAIAAPLIARALAGEALSYDWQPFPEVWQVINYVPKHAADGQVAGYYVLGSDITERKRAEAHIQGLNSELELRVSELEHVSRALRTLSAGNRTMLRASEEQELLDSMCVAIVESGAYAMAVVWYRVDDAQRTLDPRAACGYPQGVAGLRALHASWGDGERGRGAAARAIRSGALTLVRDMRGHPDYMAWQAELGGHVSVLACPLRVEGEVIGALAIYHAEADAFDADEIRLLGESADDLAFGIGTLRARAEQARIQAAMHQLTRYDALTGLPNEAVFSDLLVAAMHHSEHSGGSFAVLQTDIDRLREVNDALGFSHGDQMLQEFGARLRRVVPAHATVARLRGDEFAVLLPEAGRAEVTRLAQQLEAALAAPCLVAGIPLDLSAKTGIVLFPEHGATPHDLFRHMDIAVHEARHQGRRHVIFDPDQQLDRPGRLKLAIQLRQAIESDELRLYLQPKVEMRSGRVCGAEALLRWQHPERGLVPPGEFIGLAEDTGLIKPLTEWVLRAVTSWLRASTGAAAGLPVAVNLSARNLRDEGLLEQLRGLRSGGDYPAGLLEIEITESTVMEDAEHALRVLHGLREQGIALYVDDFGTGYSSLSYLQKLPVDFIKIDQSFVRSLGGDKDAAVIVRSTIDLVHDLGRQIVAEGIETQDAWDLLAAWGCDIAQGYFIARPMPAADFGAWAAQYRPPQ